MKHNNLESRYYDIRRVEANCHWYILYTAAGKHIHIRKQSGRVKGLLDIKDERLEVIAKRHFPLLSQDIKLILGKDNIEYYRAVNYKDQNR